MKLVLYPDALEIYDSRDSLVFRHSALHINKSDVLICTKRYRAMTVIMAGMPWEFRNVESIDWRGIPADMPRIENIGGKDI